MTSGQRVRDASVADAGACAAVYAPYVTDTAISFESEPPSVPEMARRIESARRTQGRRLPKYRVETRPLA